jgi:hypothetical protein
LYTGFLECAGQSFPCIIKRMDVEGGNIHYNGRANPMAHDLAGGK